MSEGEFQIIDRFFTHSPFGQWTSQGVGDDCALIDTGTERIAVTTDMMAVGTHFLPDCPAGVVGYKALAVNLSDLAAAGATPRAFFLSIGLPERNDSWLKEFSRGMMTLARACGCALLGGDTTRTPLVNGTHAPITISITAIGALPPEKGLTRSGARPGDDVWVSGTLGDAYAGLKLAWGHWQAEEDEKQFFTRRLEHPEPRIVLGEALLEVASAAADVSDGLLADLRHILERSNVACDLLWDAIPRSPALMSLTQAQQREAALTGGDDYELVFTALATQRDKILQLSRILSLRLTRIGKIRTSDSGDNLVLRSNAGMVIPTPSQGFNHFSE